jgi:branched-chain amino acid transport system substrate-binding protein
VAIHFVIVIYGYERLKARCWLANYAAREEQMRKLRLGRPALLALVSLAAFSAAAAPAPADQLTVYSSLPLNTPEREIYQDVVRGEQLALEQANSQAGLHTIRLVSLNDARRGRWDPEQTLRNARRAIRDDSTIAYLGEFNSGATAVSLPFLNDGGILQVSPSNSYTGLTRREGAAARSEPDQYYPSGERTYGRVAPADHLQAAALVALLESESVRRVFLVDDREVYGAGLRKMLARRLKGTGITVAGRGVVRRRGPSTALLRRIARSRAQAMVFTGISFNGAVPLWREVHRRRPRLRLIGPDGIADGVFSQRLMHSGGRAQRRLGRSAAERTLITLYTRPTDVWPDKGQVFADEFAARYGRPPGDYAIFGYEAMKVILDCVSAAGDGAPLRERVIDAFFKIRDRDSVLGRYSIDRHGDSTLSTYGVWRIDPDDRALVFDRLVDSSPT